MNPRVSAVIPCHNHADCVLNAVYSLVKQDYPVEQVVVVDDGSTDGSSATIREGMSFSSCQGGITVGAVDGFKTPIILLSFDRPRGPAFARNQGIRYAWQNTELFALLDADDLYLPGKIRRSVEKWLESPELIGAVYSDYETFNPISGLVVREYKPPYSREHLMRECIVNCDSLVSRDAFEKCGLFDESQRVCEDYALWASLSEKFLLSHLPENLLRIRVGERSSTSTVPKQVWEECWRRVMLKFQNHSRAG